jgi:ABC-type transport system involved in cytochrome bd biosynthesis fused ATPase/permease subunit
VFPAPLMTTISELGSFIAREKNAAAPLLPPGAVVRVPIFPGAERLGEDHLDPGADDASGGDSGRARVAGLDVRKDARAIRSLIGLAGQYPTVDELLTGRENLELIGLLYHLDKAVYRRRAQDALERMSLSGAGDNQVKICSGGMRRRLDLATSLIGRPPVLFLDEPTTGLDPRTRNDLWQFIEVLLTEGTKLNSDALRSVVGLCEQDAHIFDSTLHENLRLARPAAADTELHDALRRARLGDWADSLPAGLDTPVGEHGARLSGGQRQRLARARVLLADFPVVILDEPAEHLDEETAGSLTADLLAATAGRGVLLITHRPVLAVRVDHVLRLSGGRLAEVPPA